MGDRQRYRLDKRLGAGGMGDVFLAMDTLLGKQVALKLLKATLVGSEELRKRFEREVALCAALSSDHIVEVSDYGVTPEGYPFFVMEYLRGESLGQLLRRFKRLDVTRTVGIISQVCEGLRKAHQGVTLWRNGATVSDRVKIVHRDLKPDNIFLVPTALGELVKILDFGIAKIRNEAAEYTNLTGMFIGTFRYAAPEQLVAEENLDGRADIYSLGVILYEMLSGTDPFGLGLNRNNISEASWVLAHTSKQPIPLLSQPGCGQFEPELEAVVMRCLQKIPDDRFARVDELQQVLKAAVAVESRASDTAIPQSPTASGQDCDNKTIFRPLIPSEQKIPDGTIAHIPPLSEQSSDNISIKKAADASLASQQSSLLKILTEFVGPVAPNLLRQVSAQALSTEELVENLAFYLAPKQQIEFKNKALSLLGKTPAQPQTKFPLTSPSLKNQAIDASFVKQCERHLAELIGPIATFFIQKALKSHPQISPTELVQVLVAEIPDSKKASEFCQRLLEL